MNGWICNKCGSDDKSVSNFYHIRGRRFDMENPEHLCWDCKYPILQERMKSSRKPEGIELEETYCRDELPVETKDSSDEFIPSLDRW